MLKIKRLVKKLFYSFRCDEKSYIEHLRAGGAKIGERVRIFDPHSTIIDVTRPFMLEIINTPYIL